MKTPGAVGTWSRRGRLQERVGWDVQVSRFCMVKYGEVRFVLVHFRSSEDIHMSGFKQGWPDVGERAHPEKHRKTL